MKEDKKKIVISILVKNESGVLTRVTGLFARRGFNIDSLSVGETEDVSQSRITVTMFSDSYEEEQVIKQLEKLEDVVVVESMDTGNIIFRELLLIKVNCTEGQRSQILEAVSIFRAKVVDLCPTSLTVEITGESSKCDAFLEYLRPYGIAELCRTGATALGRGKKTLKG